MPLDTPAFREDLQSPGAGRFPALSAKVDALNRSLTHYSAWDVIRAARDAVHDLVLVSSFGAESVVLLHLVSMADRDVPVIFIDTEMLFAETLVYQQEVAEQLGLRNLRIVKSEEIAQKDPAGLLHKTDQDACCTLRKVAPLERALAGAGGWITGRKRFQSGQRAALDFFELDALAGRIKVNPLAYWKPDDIQEYIAENRLPRHPLVARGYPSIGCAPCTTPVNDDEDPRAGRWRNTEKQECGIHFANGKAIRLGETR